MKTVLVVLGFKVASSQGENLAVVPPQKTSDDDIEGISNNNLCPLGLTEDTDRSDVHNPFVLLARILTAKVCLVRNVNRDENADTDEGEDEEHVAAHASKAQEYGSIHANLVDENFFAGRQQSGNPRPKLVTNGGRGVFLVGMFEFGCVNGLMMRSDEREGDGDCSGDT